ncbi:putative proteinase inhibitor I3, Kunitz legume, kunitz inhibitor STI-like superfamily [Helianthus annuus]|uniref:Uncharacterized protein n=1 Tax=Helianthus annuus TaxID=4232 RepID=A0A251UGD5_HELAN|nr:miraculin [Helianthus annuus]KAF5800673.1 putative proteinase inhibitor I3, Kunitz legume, kunitz inhibitor STI-like superfamily [Helianthus annuus]KAJ0559065.1 putative proteinase inhibitor I3, Kunitz legume, kunitz inhibitor STI-like superfamily [Helianthus annuus]KAJ0572011.1 putative proteinase inhibitor I3, Kunitz legume, kunitz inhibitor STI-like superfamily [Helianthus annuus]KAJ0739419.1 putative proteinase inhibitor I3, Kunitz legume, kunitz inhibitor STI-like superfamily [Helianthu
MKIIIIFSVLAFIILAASSAPAPVVLDFYGQSLRARAKYYIKSADDDDLAGGFGLVGVLNKSCPAVVGQMTDNMGLWLTFHPVDPKERVIRLSTDVNIKFSGSNSCHESNVWQLKYHKALEQYVVMVGGVEGNPGPKTVNNWFKIEQGIYGGYRLVFCPSVCSDCKVICGGITTGPDVENLAQHQGPPLIFSNSTDPWPFSFYFKY